MLSLSFQAFANDNNKTSITLNEDNGIKTLTIVTNESNGKKTEIYKNKDAEAKLAELEKSGNVTKTVVIAPDGTMYTKIEIK